MLEAIRSLSAYKQSLETISTNDVRSFGLGLARSVRLPFVAALQHDYKGDILIICDRPDRVLTVLDELHFWIPDVKISSFPEPNPLFYERAGWTSSTRQKRLQVLTDLAMKLIPGLNRDNSSQIIVAPIRAVMTRTLPRREFIKKTYRIRVGKNYQLETLTRNLVEIGYQHAEMVVEVGHFSRRGGILDLWTPAEDFPVRFDFFGDELDTLRVFDPATQRTIRECKDVLVTPAREYLPLLANDLGVDADEINEYYSPAIHSSPASIFDYLGGDAIIVFDDIDAVSSSADSIEEQAVKTRREYIKDELLSEDFPIPYISWSELYDTLSIKRKWFDLGRYGSPQILALSECFEPGLRFGGHLKSLMSHMVERSQVGECMYVVSRQSTRLKTLWGDRTGVVEFPRQPEFVEGTLADGWVLTHDDGKRIHLLTDSEVFGWERPKPRQSPQPVSDTPEMVYADLGTGDWVVHIDHGIGRYLGLVSRTIENVEREFLCVEYAEGDQLFVPVHQADRLTRFVGPDGREPGLTRLGTADWESAKQRVREAVREIAKDLLEIYAKRMVAEGYSFGGDMPWQKEMEASFPYIETDDQLLAVAEVKRDMESSRPMDRLLCGDVGYGKTEVALRSAFKAVLNGKQVAVLVPTTVLAQQHFDTFRQRLSAFPVEVEMLSRFRTPKQQANIITGLRKGTIDIVIGTHRLLQEDVQFKDIGLVIIDEEQRFGVTHKEYFKKMRAELDVLTLTATPIPRTLYMALTGVRDISTINTAPEERLPVTTHVGPYSPQLVRQAILRELERGGQVFFVHNRVHTIAAMQSHLNQLVPEAKVRIAHGQMPEAELSEVMQLFTHGEVDVLLCTSIIESGLDIPNANTLIVDRGDTFGLAQLYQLRGRVGRGAQRAYAYFFRHRRKPPTPEGRERLEVIAENTQLGSGYSIAMRDLEMRGAGEILGTRQHGYIASVGFFMYSSLLAKEIRELRKQEGLSLIPEDQVTFKEIKEPVSVELPLSIGIPADYVGDQNLRLSLYRRIAGLETEAEIDAIAEEFVDRFGPIPVVVENLFYQAKVKLLAERVGLALISIEAKQIVMRYPMMSEGLSKQEISFETDDVRIGKNGYWLKMADDPEVWKMRIIEVLSAIIENQSEQISYLKE